MKKLKQLLLYLLELIKFIPYTLTSLPSQNRILSEDSNDALIIKLDEIGDYILFRNILPELKKNVVPYGGKLVLCGNILWREISEAIDREYVDEFIWIDKVLFGKSLSYRTEILNVIHSRDFTTVLNYSQSRKFYLDDFIVNVSVSKNKVGINTDLSNIYPWQKRISDRYYTKLINTNLAQFEFLKNKLFTEIITGHSSDIIKPALPQIGVVKFNFNNKYLVFSIGARFKHKRWPANFFAKTAEAFSKNYSIVLTGSREDKKYIDEFRIFYNNFIDLSGKTSLLELIPLIVDSEAVVSNDSGIVHIAAALNKKCLVVHSGTHYGRFLPYPADMNIQQTVVHPPELTKITQKEREQSFYYRSHLKLETISPEMVISELQRFLEH